MQARRLQVLRAKAEVLLLHLLLLLHLMLFKDVMLLQLPCPLSSKKRSAPLMETLRRPLLPSPPPLTSWATS